MMIEMAGRGELIKVSAIAVDVDGTITDHEHHVCLEAIDVLRRAESKGVHVILVSGNVLPVTWALSRFIGTTGPIVAENGCVICHEKRIYDLCDSKPVFRAYDMIKKRIKVERLFTDQWRRNEVVLKKDVDPEKVRSILRGQEVEVYDSGFGIHIVPKNVNKLKGLEFAARLIQIPLYRIMAIGDGENDLEMVNGSGIGVAVANAAPSVRAVADFITPSSDGQGVVEAIEDLVFQVPMGLKRQNLLKGVHD